MSSMNLSTPPEPIPGRASIVSRTVKVWPALICGGAMVVLTAVGMFIFHRRWMGTVNWYAETAFVSFVLAQIALVTILGGLIGRHWLIGWALAVVLTCMQTVISMIVITYPELGGQAALQHLSLCGLWPVLLLATCAPLVLLRTLRGWTLSLQPQIALPRWRSSLEDLILVGVVLASSITISQLFVFAEGPQNLPQVLAVMGLFAATSLVCVPLVVYVSFRSRNWTRRSIGWLLLSGLAFVLMVIENGIMQDGTLTAGLEDLPDIIIGVLAGCLTVAVGILSLLASGFRLTHFEKTGQLQSAAAVESNPKSAQVSLEAMEHVVGDDHRPFDAEWLDDAQPSPRRGPFKFTPQWQARLIACGSVAVAAAGVACMEIAQQSERDFFNEIRQLNVREVYVENGSVSGLTFGTHFVNADLKQYLKYRDTLTSLSFAGTKITDAILPELQAFTQLQELDLSATAVTDAGLQQLTTKSAAWVKDGGLEGCQRLSLADTRVTWSGAQQLVQRAPVQYLDLAGLSIGDAELETPIGVPGLGLSRTSITDEGLKKLVTNSRYARLDLSDTSITGATLDTPDCPASLNLDGTRINDATLTAMLNTGNVSSLSLRRTGITAAVLPKLNGLSIRLGNGLITEDDLANMAPTSFQQLSLNSTRFTGHCMTTGRIKASSLDLSGSSVTDDILVAIGQSRLWFQFMGLADTMISDKGLHHLNSVGELDLRHTRVTARGIIGSHSSRRVVVSIKQFSPQELCSLKHTSVEFLRHPLLEQGF